MPVKKRKYNPNIIKSRFSYTFQEIANTYGLHIRTIQLWYKEGLKVIEGGSRPYFVMGADVRSFLKVRSSKRKLKLETDEFYCTKCREARKGKSGTIYVQYTDKQMGNNSTQAFIKSKCEACGTSLTRFSTDKKVDEMQMNGLKFKQRDIRLYDKADYSVNTDI